MDGVCFAEANGVTASKDWIQQESWILHLCSSEYPEPNLLHFFGLYSKQLQDLENLTQYDQKWPMYCKLLIDSCELIGFPRALTSVPGKGNRKV